MEITTVSFELEESRHQNLLPKMTNLNLNRDDEISVAILQRRILKNRVPIAVHRVPQARRMKKTKVSLIMEGHEVVVLDDPIHGELHPQEIRNQKVNRQARYDEVVVVATLTQGQHRQGMIRTRRVEEQGALRQINIPTEIREQPKVCHPTLPPEVTRRMFVNSLRVLV